jgi:hypothetical protein
MTDQTLTPFMQKFRGGFTSALRWHHLEALWQTLKASDEQWYIYAIGEEPPTQVSDKEALHRFIDEVDQLLRAEHEEDYCGIVYADNLANPSIVKIYDPNNLGVSCGYSDNPPLPGWVLSQLPPEDIPANAPVPKNRRRWWQRLLG